jgi:hypothetical protein
MFQVGSVAVGRELAPSPLGHEAEAETIHQPLRLLKAQLVPAHRVVVFHDSISFTVLSKRTPMKGRKKDPTDCDSGPNVSIFFFEDADIKHKLMHRN